MHNTHLPKWAETARFIAPRMRRIWLTSINYRKNSKRSSNILLALCEEWIFLERSHKITSRLISTTHAQGLIDLSYHKNSKRSSNIRLGLCEERIFLERSHKITS